MKRPLKAIFFDIDDTLFSTREFARKARLNAINKMLEVGLKYDKQKLYDELLEVVKEFSANYDHHFDKLLSRIPKQSYTGINPALITAAAVIGYHNTKHKHLKPFSDAITALKELSNKKIILGIITAGLTIKQCEKIIRLSLHKYFDSSSIFISDQIGISKPNPKLFLHVTKKLRLKPMECMYVGNSIENDIIPAKKAGLYTVLIDRNTKFQAEKTIPDFYITKLTNLMKLLKNFRI